MGRVSDAQLQTWAKNLMADQECLQEVRDRFQMRMLAKFRKAAPAERELINAIMDNEVLFFDELKAIVAKAETVNDDPDEDSKGAEINQ